MRIKIKKLIVTTTALFLTSNLFSFQLLDSSPCGIECFETALDVSDPIAESGDTLRAFNVFTFAYEHCLGFC